MSNGKKKGNGNYPSYRKAHHRPWWKSTLKRLTLWGFGLGIPLLAIVFFTLPNIDNLNKFTKTPSILLKSEDGEIIGSFGDIYGDYIPFKELPRSLVDAVVATEDRNFYHHFGVDPFGMARALVADIRARHFVQGGSTITQQVAKNVFLTSERSILRKIREMMLAIKLERRFSKEDILSIYLNRVYLGAGNYGVDAAAHRYFDKSARDLSLSESAIMAGLLKAPSRFAPTSNPQLARKRADQVLLNMQDAGYLTAAQTENARQALAQRMSSRQRQSQSAMYFADWIMDQLPEYIGDVQDDLVVVTTLRPQWQAEADKAMTQVMDKEGASHDASQAAIVAMTPDGAVRVMIGGRNYGASQYNRAEQALRQPGSSFKLFVYLAGLESGYTPDTVVEDQPLSIPIVGGHWEPKNYTGRYLGEMPLRDAVAESVNTVAVQVAMRAGLGHVIEMAQRLGISSDIDEVPSIALGATEVSLLELTTAYAHLASGGAVVYPYGIIDITTSHGEPVYHRHTTGIDGVALRSDIVSMMDDMLEGVIDHGTGKAATIGRPAAGKTGTTSDYRDAWFMGFTPDLVTGVWVGNDDNTPMKKVTGGMLPAMIWHDFMIPALANIPPRAINANHPNVVLPWQGENATPVSAEEERNQQRRGSAKLGKSFWDKLFGR